MIERIDPTPFEPGRFFRDLQTAAAAIGAPFRTDRVQEALRVFADEWNQCVVQLKATCRPGSGLYYRFFYKEDKDLTSLAQRQAMIASGRAPIVTLQEEILGRFPGATRAGLDFDTGFGLAKVWTFTGGPTPVEEIGQLRSVPEAVRANAGFFARHGLRHVFFVASDHQSDTMNVYFGLEPDCRHEGWLRRLAEETSGLPKDAEVYRQMIASLAVSAGVGTTFRWDSPDMGRWALYALNIPCQDSGAVRQLPPLAPRLQRLRDRAPTLNCNPQFNLAWSFGRAGFYTKLEKSYARDADYFLTVEMGGDLTHPAALETKGRSPCTSC